MSLDAASLHDQAQLYSRLFQTSSQTTWLERGCEDEVRGVNSALELHTTLRFVMHPPTTLFGFQCLRFCRGGEQDLGNFVKAINNIEADFIKLYISF